MSKTRAYDCSRFESYTNPCPNRDNEILKNIRHLVTEGPTPIFNPSDIFEKANEICSNCDFFEKT